MWCLCLLIYTIFISILYVSLEGLGLIESYQQIYDFYKPVTFEKQRHWTSVKNLKIQH